ncbi:hypothetical protein HOD96_01170 [Candidatus Falkowbacteria bacterium]|jgi:hypothetical protein|nr:hypothetical protein [Candidatus Falkowbacteria bacterium]MBT4432930.1 hypothetical protein [Candidatus Falkowbacteria bacterium]
MIKNSFKKILTIFSFLQFFLLFKIAKADLGIFEPDHDYPTIIEGAAGHTKAMMISFVKGVLSLLAVIFVMLIIYGGFAWMTAGATSANKDKARKILINSTIGAIVVLFSYAFVKLVFETTGS